MATITVLTADRIIEFENLDIVGGVVDETGDLILQKRSGEEVNLGNVKLHSQLFGLEEDDHVQYALADGTRGSFATVEQGTKADNARPNTSGEILLDGDDVNGFLERVIVVHDGTDSSSWVNRMEYWFRDTGGVPDRRVTYINEAGELRGAPARLNTVAARWFAKEFPDRPVGARDPDVPVVEVMDDRVTRTNLFGILGDGTVITRGIPTAYTIVLGPADPVPAGTPAGTVIVRTT